MTTIPPRSPATHSGNSFRELHVDECLELLADSSIARIAWCSADGPRVVPVTIALHDGSVVFRTTAYSALAHAARGSTLAVEVDGFDLATRTGWSVVAVGTADTVADPRDLVELWRQDGPEPWAPGVRTLFVRVVPRRITGRRIAHR